MKPVAGFIGLFVLLGVFAPRIGARVCMLLALGIALMVIYASYASP